MTAYLFGQLLPLALVLALLWATVQQDRHITYLRGQLRNAGGRDDWNTRCECCRARMRGAPTITHVSTRRVESGTETTTRMWHANRIGCAVASRSDAPALLVSDKALFDKHVNAGRRDALAEWAKANGLDPDSISVTEPLTVYTEADGRRTIRYSVYLLNEDGARYIDPEQPDLAAREWRTAPCRVEPPYAWCTPARATEAHR